MKLIERMVEAAFETSNRLKQFKNDVDLNIVDFKIKVNKDVTTALESLVNINDRVADLTTAVVNITQTIQLHQKAITDIYNMQAAINNALQDRRATVELPETKKTKNEKPN